MIYDLHPSHHRYSHNLLDIPPGNDPDIRMIHHLSVQPLIIYLLSSIIGSYDMTNDPIEYIFNSFVNSMYESNKYHSSYHIQSNQFLHYPDILVISLCQNDQIFSLSDPPI